MRITKRIREMVKSEQAIAYWDALSGKKKGGQGAKLESTTAARRSCNASSTKRSSPSGSLQLQAQAT